MSEISVSNDWTGYTVVFSPLSWLGVFIVVAASSMVVYVVSKAKCDRSARDAVVFAVASLLLKELDPGFASSSNATSMRIACLTTLLYGFIVFTAYTATMTSFLSVAVIGPGIENFRDLMESGKILLRFKVMQLNSMNKSAGIKLRILSGSAMHSSIRHSKKGTEMREIYHMIRRDPSTLVDSYANWRDLVLEGYAVIRPLEDAYLLMQKHPCQIHAPRGIFHTCT